MMVKVIRFRNVYRFFLWSCCCSWTECHQSRYDLDTEHLLQTCVSSLASHFSSYDLPSELCHLEILLFLTWESCCSIFCQSQLIKDIHVSGLLTSASSGPLRWQQVVVLQSHHKSIILTPGSAGRDRENKKVKEGKPRLIDFQGGHLTWSYGIFWRESKKSFSHYFEITSDLKSTKII